MKNTILIEGYTMEELLAFTDEQWEHFVFVSEPITFRMGTAEMLGSFRVRGSVLVMELAQIEGGGEGVLPSLWQLASRFALRRNLTAIEWLVHAVNCARPNPKLRRVLERRGFVVEEVEGIGSVYRLYQNITE